ncbi:MULTISPECIES: hypothetical protein [unclassified Curtobacterium]|uniref:hypothetical protein n=1 Tax=unclassified Curtobacterium TaxID=257496 RepID=UPI0011B6F41A|nr:MULTISPECIES: hypothetical protein [unclassified Curtobacterium]WIB25187.1 hypothetical protein DEJ18_08865 [Curtobacterium sp. MCSS17_015]
MTGRRAGITGLLAAMTVALTGCTLPAKPGPQDYVGTWRLQTASGAAAARFEVADDHTYTAHDIPASIACGTKVYSGSLGFYTYTLDAPRPDYVFTRDSSMSR